MLIRIKWFCLRAAHRLIDQASGRWEVAMEDDVLIISGYLGSGPTHWQSWLERTLPQARDPLQNSGNANHFRLVPRHQPFAPNSPLLHHAGSEANDGTTTTGSQVGAHRDQQPAERSLVSDD